MNTNNNYDHHLVRQGFDSLNNYNNRNPLYDANENADYDTFVRDNNNLYLPPSPQQNESKTLDPDSVSRLALASMNNNNEISPKNSSKSLVANATTTESRKLRAKMFNSVLTRHDLTFENMIRFIKNNIDSFDAINIATAYTYLSKIFRRDNKSLYLLTHDESKVLDKIKELICKEDNLALFRAQELSNISTATREFYSEFYPLRFNAAVLNEEDSVLLGKISSEAKKKLGTFTIQNLTAMAKSYALLGYRDENLFKLMIPIFIKKLKIESYLYDNLQKMLNAYKSLNINSVALEFEVIKALQLVKAKSSVEIFDILKNYNKFNKPHLITALDRLYEMLKMEKRSLNQLNDEHQQLLQNLLVNIVAVFEDLDKDTSNHVLRILKNLGIKNKDVGLNNINITVNNSTTYNNNNNNNNTNTNTNTTTTTNNNNNRDNKNIKTTPLENLVVSPLNSLNTETQKRINLALTNEQNTFQSIINFCIESNKLDFFDEINIATAFLRLAQKFRDEEITTLGLTDKDKDVLKRLRELASKDFNINNFKAQELSNICWALQMFGIEDKLLLGKIATAAKRNVDTLTEQHLGCIVHTFQVFKYNDESLFKHIEEAFLEKLKTEFVHTLNLTKISNAFKLLNIGAPQLQSKIGRLLAVINAKSSEELFEILITYNENFETPTLIIALENLNKLLKEENTLLRNCIELNQEIIKNVTQKVLNIIPTLNPETLSRLAYSYYNLGISDPGSFKAIAESAMGQIDRFSLNELSQLGAAFVYSKNINANAIFIGILVNAIGLKLPELLVNSESRELNLKNLKMFREAAQANSYFIPWNEQAIKTK